MLRASIALACLTFTTMATAQEPRYATTAPSPVMAAITSSDVGTPPPDALSLPMRLSLLTYDFPRGHMTGASGCGPESVEAAGTILPTQLDTQVRLTPRLTLFGFSNLGCPGDPLAALDAGAGGGFTYTVPMKKDSWLVFSGGGYGQPTLSGLAGRWSAGAGLDMMWKLSRGRTMSTGVGLVGSGRGARVMLRTGGTF